MKKLRKKNFFRHEKKCDSWKSKINHFQPIVMIGKKAKICIYKSAEISAWAGALKKCEKNVPKKFQSEGLRRI